MLDVKIQKKQNAQLRYYKNNFALFRNIMNIVMNYIKLDIAYKKEKQAKVW